MQPSASRRRVFAVPLSALVLFFMSVSVAHAALNDSGQTQCYDTADAAAACTDAVTGDTAAHPRQDGRFGRDAQATAGALAKTGGGEAGFDFTKISNAGNVLPAAAAPGANPGDWACTQDNITGLVWEIKSDDIASLRYKDATYTWGNAAGSNNCSLGAGQCNTDAYVAAVNAAGLCGHNDWRLPSRRELLSIVHYGRSFPAIDPAWFPDTIDSRHWSGEAYTAVPGFSWVTGFATGTVDTTNKNADEGVRLVRGPAMPVAAFVDNGDGTVSDSVTGLMWMKCSRGQSGANCAVGSATEFSWAGALGQAVAANEANESGYNDWRLPGAKELESLIDATRSGPAIDTVLFPNTSPDQYWSSTTHPFSPVIAWLVFFLDGEISGSGKIDANQVRLVRGGQSFDRLLPATMALAQTGASATASSFSATLETAPAGVSATGYWLVRAAADPAPTPAELTAGGPGVAAGSGATGSGQTQAFTATGLTAGTQYVLYYAARDAANHNLNLIRKQAFKGGVMAAPASIPALDGAGLAALALALGALVARRQSACGRSGD